MTKQYLTEDEIEELYNDMLDECYETIDICGLTYTPSLALKRVDPIAYDCGCSDFISSLTEDDDYGYDDNGYYRIEEGDDDD